ncbi:MAG: hypothetical protein JWM28_99 [Chitinophagaceae bacterium]|nr:hypothetical protein [Chitinophagaceae bacterium]
MKNQFNHSYHRILKPLKNWFNKIVRWVRDDDDDNQFNHPCAIL